MEEFAKDLCERLDTETSRKLRVGKQGIGLHVIGIEEINGYKIPELFLISNFKDTFYTDIGDLKCSRHTYHTIANVDPAQNHQQFEYRKEVNRFLNETGFIIYNNGDPIMFNPIKRTHFFIPIMRLKKEE